MEKLNVLRIVMFGEEKPSYTITRAFEHEFNTHTIFWEDYGNNLDYLNEVVKHTIENGNFDAVFMQIQREGIIKPYALQNVYNKLPIFNWTGDVREHVNDYTPLGKECITLFSNYTDVIKMRGLGFRADYLQTGYDNYYYSLENLHRLNRIVFIGNNYNAEFEQTNFRKQVVEAMHSEFGEDFVLHGGGWNYLRPDAKPTLSKKHEKVIYNSNLLSINVNHINRQRYYSDRQLRSMACGAFTMVQEYEDAELEFQNGVHFESWKTIDELIEKCKLRMINRDETLRLSRVAADFVYNNCTWFSRVKEFSTLINKYKQ